MASKISSNKLAKNANGLANVMPGRLHIEPWLRTRRSLEDQAVRSRRRQMQSVSAVARRRKRAPSLSRVSLLADKPD